MNKINLICFVLFLKEITCENNTFKLLIHHANNLNGRFDEITKFSSVCYSPPCYGGFARISEIVNVTRQKEIEGQGPNSLFLVTGKIFANRYWEDFNETAENRDLEILNYLNPDAITTLNLDSNYINDKYANVLQRMKSKFIVTNINYKISPLQDIVRSYVIIEKNKTKIGIIGYVTPKILNPSHLDYIFYDEIQSLNVRCSHLKNLGVDIIIALSYSSFFMDKEVARKVPLVDIVIGGRSDKFFYNLRHQPDIEVINEGYPYIVNQNSGKKVPVVQAFKDTKYLGQILLEFDSNGDLINYKGKPILLKNTAKDEGMDKIVKKYQNQLSTDMSETVGKTHVLLDGTINCRKQECNLGNLITDSMIIYHSDNYNSSKFWTNTPIAIIYSETIRSSIYSNDLNGNITKRDMLEIISDNFHLVSFKVTGEILMDVLKKSVLNYTDTLGNFLQTSGLMVTYNTNNIYLEKSETVVEAKARCAFCEIPHFENIELNRTYKILSTFDFYYDLYENNKNNLKFTDNITHLEVYEDRLIDAIEYYIRKKRLVYPEIENRINFDGGKLWVSKGISYIQISLISMLISLLAIFL